MRELIPSQLIPAGAKDPAGPSPLPALPGPLPDPPVLRLDGSTATAAEVFADTYTDALVVLQDGQLVAERYDAGMIAATPHLLMSVSKSIVGCVAGVLADRGLLDPGAPVTAYVPEAEGSGYADASIRNLLDMRTGVAFRETYTALDAEVRVMERSMGWRPARPGDPVGAYPYLTTLGHAGPHGREFTYRSADSDMLGWACERASDTRMADLVSAHHLAADRGRTGRRDHLRSAGFGHPRRRHLGHRARPGQVRADARRRRHGPKGTRSSRRPGWPAPAPLSPMSARPSRSPTTSSSCRAAGTAISSGSSRDTAAPCWSASASTASSSTPTVPRGPWWSSCRPGPTRRTRPTCWTAARMWRPGRPSGGPGALSQPVRPSRRAVFFATPVRRDGIDACGPGRPRRSEAT